MKVFWIALLFAACSSNPGGSNANPDSNDPGGPLEPAIAGSTSSFATGMNKPSALAIDRMGNTYVADSSAHLVRRITANGMSSVFAGTGIGGNNDGPGASAQFTSPSGLAFDSQGNLFVSDSVNQTIRKISPSGFVSTFAGSGFSGSSDGNGTSATFNQPTALAFDAHDNLFVADLGNSIIRKITPTGNVSTFAGSAGLSGTLDGQGSSARFATPFAVAVNKITDVVYVTDTTNHNLRAITFNQTVSTFAGSTNQTHGTINGVGTAARFFTPSGIAITRGGTLYVSDTGNNIIRTVTSEGVVNTVGSGCTGVAVVCPSSPLGIAYDGQNAMYIGAWGTNTIVKLF